MCVLLLFVVIIDVKEVYKFRGRGYNMSNGKWHMVFATGRDDYAAGYAGLDGTIYSGN